MASTLINTEIATKNRYDFVYIFDVKDGNPNGDPDFDNMPRFDPETYQGLVSDVSLKRKIRDFVHVAKSGEKGFGIYVQSGTSLQNQQEQPYVSLEELRDKAKGKSTKPEDVQLAKEWMCQNFFDIRAFGAVMNTTDFRCGQVRGPLQITFARSTDPILSAEHGITRIAYTLEKKRLETTGQTEMGNKKTVAYGLYVAHGFINPHLAKQTEFTEEDVELVWQALTGMFELDRSASRGLMSARNLFVFKHESALGNAPAHKLFDLCQPKLKEGKEFPRSYSDYELISLEELKTKVPQGISVEDKLA
jgi:CRISPR-associated protein Csd2